MEYNWNSNDLRNDLKTLEKMLKEEKNPKIREKIMLYIRETKDTIISLDTESFENTKEGINVENLISLYKTVPTFELYYPFIKEFKNKLYNFFKHYKIKNTKEKPTTTNLTKEDIVELVHELFKSTNKEIYEIYLKIIKEENRIRFRTTENKISNHLQCNAAMYFIPGLNKTYVSIDNYNEDKKARSLISLTHEEGHSIASQINPERYINNQAFFNEIESIFFELIGYDFFEKELNDEHFKTRALEFLENDYFEAETILDKVKLANILFERGNPVSTELKLEDKKMQDTLNEVLYSGPSLKQEIKYLFSHIIAIELYEIYKEDKDLALELLKRIITTPSNINEYEGIVSNVTPTKRLIKYKNSIK